MIAKLVKKVRQQKKGKDQLFSPLTHCRIGSLVDVIIR